MKRALKLLLAGIGLMWVGLYARQDGAEMSGVKPDPQQSALALPAELREPIATAGEAAVPSRISGYTLLAMGLLPPLVLWFGLAWRRAWLADETRQLRAARRALLRLLQRAAQRGAMPTAAELETWRQLVPTLVGMDRAAPSPAELAAHIRGNAGADWAALWQETEAALFSPRATVRDDWLPRALETIRGFETPRRPPLGPWRRCHWLPATTLALIATFFGPAPTRADPVEAYRAGRYREAADAWRRELDNRPGDWSAHHNLGLVAAQENNWGLAAAHSLAAYVLQPGNPSVDGILRLALTKVEAPDPVLLQLLVGPWQDRLVGRLSPARWEGLGRVGVVITAVALAMVVGLFYTRRREVTTHPGAPRQARGPEPAEQASRHPSQEGITKFRQRGIESPLERGARRAGCVGRRAQQASLAVAAASAAVTVVAFWSVRRYGALADPLAAVVATRTELRSIPSDMVARQRPLMLLPGTVVVVDRSFLGWDHVTAAGNLSGWIRNDAAVWLYRTRDRSQVRAVYAADVNLNFAVQFNHELPGAAPTQPNRNGLN